MSPPCVAASRVASPSRPLVVPRRPIVRCGASGSAAAGRELYLGLDVGTSGARACVIDAEAQITSEASCSYEGDARSSDAWARCAPRHCRRCRRRLGTLTSPLCSSHTTLPCPPPSRSALYRLLDAVPAEQRGRIAALAIDGTSATTLLIDGSSGRCLAPPKMYNEAQGADAVARTEVIAPRGHTATASTSTLCKVLAWDEQGSWQSAATQGAQPAFCHQAGGGMHAVGREGGTGEEMRLVPFAATQRHAP